MYFEAPATVDDDDAVLQEAIRASLAEADEERRRRAEEERVAAASELAAKRDRAEGVQQASPWPKGLAESFAPGEWLNDASIIFAYSRIGSSLGSSIVSSDPTCGTMPVEAVLLMDPATVFWLAVQSDQLLITEARQALRLEERGLIFCPINDGGDRGLADGGTHWTLLVCWGRQERFTAGCRDAAYFVGRFSYYDSLGSGTWRSENFQRAKTLASRLAGEPVQLSVGLCARQTNSFDCGVYVLIFSEIVLRAFLELTSALKRRDTSASYEFARVLPGWEENLAAVTPRVATDCRNYYYKTFSEASLVAAAGA